MKNSKFIFTLIAIIILSNNALATELGTNLVKNPSFENGWNNATNSPMYWGSPALNWYGILDASTKYNGEYSYRLTSNSKADFSYIIYDELIEVKENETYLIRTHVKYQNAKAPHVAINKFDSDNNEITWLISIPDEREGSSSWEEHFNLFKVPEDTTKIKIYLQAGYVNDKNAGNATTWFDDIEFIDPAVVNPTKYEPELTLTKGESWQVDNDFALYLEDTTKESASMSLIYRGHPLVNQIINKGDYTTFEYNKNKLLIFKLDNLFEGTDNQKVWLKEVLAGSISSDQIKAPKLELSLDSPDAAIMEKDVPVNVSVTNRGEKTFEGDVEIIVELGGKPLNIEDNLKLDANEKKDYSFLATAPEKPEEYNVNAILKTRYSSLNAEEKPLLVKVQNPIITTLSPDLREGNGIRGVVTIDSAYAERLVDWDTKASIEVFRIMENGKENVYSREVPVKSKSFDIGISYDEFYRGDGRYLVTIKAGDMENERFFEIKGPDGEYAPSGGEVIPPTVVSNALYPQLMLLLIGMVAALSVSKHMHPGSRSLPLDIVSTGCGTLLLIAGMVQGLVEMTGKGVILAGIGISMIFARRNDTRIHALLMRSTPIHDFAGLILIFMSASYLVFLIPEWNILVIIATLIIYYTLINLHGERKFE